MKKKEILQLFVPPIYYRVKKMLFPKTVSKNVPLPKIKRKSNKMIVIGNGPSLNKSFEKYKDIICDSDCIVVNFFASTDMFKIIRPAVYVLNDRAFFDIPEKLKLSINKLFTNIVENTDWNMKVVLPCTEQDSQLVEILSQNSHIEFLYFNVINNTTMNNPILDNVERNIAWDNNLIAPPDATVLNVSVWLSLYWGYPETYLIGADTSWIEELRIDQQTNKLYTIDRHFYNNSKDYKDDNLLDCEHRRILPNSMYVELKCITACFKNYEYLEDFARWKGLKVYNASEYSLIDSFERKKIM